MKAGLSASTMLRRGIARGSAMLYVRRRTTQRGTNRVLVSIVAPLRYAICVLASYRTDARAACFSQELHSLIRLGLERRLGQDWEAQIDKAYAEYVAQCTEAGEENIFETVNR